MVDLNTISAYTFMLAEEAQRLERKAQQVKDLITSLEEGKKLSGTEINRLQRILEENKTSIIEALIQELKHSIDNIDTTIVFELAQNLASKQNLLDTVYDI